MSRQLKDSLLKEKQTVLDAYKYWDAHNKLDCNRDTIIKIFFSSMAATIAGISVVPFGKSTYEGSELIPLCNYSVSHDFCQANAEAGSYFLNWSLNTLYLLQTFQSIFQELPCSLGKKTEKTLSQILSKESKSFDSTKIGFLVINTIVAFLSALPFYFLSKESDNPEYIALTTLAAYTALHYAGSVFVMDSFKDWVRCCKKEKGKEKGKEKDVLEKFNELSLETKKTVPVFSNKILESDESTILILFDMLASDTFVIIALNGALTVAPENLFTKLSLRTVSL